MPGPQRPLTLVGHPLAPLGCFGEVRGLEVDLGEIVAHHNRAVVIRAQRSQVFLEDGILQVPGLIPASDVLVFGRFDGTWIAVDCRVHGSHDALAGRRRWGTRVRRAAVGMRNRR